MFQDDPLVQDFGGAKDPSQGGVRVMRCQAEAGRLQIWPSIFGERRRRVIMRWPRLVGQLGGLFKVYSDCHSYRQNLLGQIFLSLLLRL